LKDAIFEQIYKQVMVRLEQDLPEYLTYHNAHHTAFVVDKAIMLAKEENITGRDLELVKIAALYHDTGFLSGHLEHEDLGCQIAAVDLPHLLSQDELNKVCGMITATKIPQTPHNILEKIVADADLFYLGTSNYKKFSQKLFLELKHFDPLIDDNKWLEIQVKFLSFHSYHTTYGKKILEPVKQKILKALQKEKNRKVNLIIPNRFKDLPEK
jgi:uncharacterized protein